MCPVSQLETYPIEKTADGSVHMIAFTIDPETHRLGNRQDGVSVDAGKY